MWLRQNKLRLENIANAFGSTFAIHTSQCSDQKLQKSYQANTQRQTAMYDRQAKPKKTTPYNSTYKKLAIQWLNEVRFFNQTFVQADSFVLRNRQLLIAAKR